MKGTALGCRFYRSEGGAEPVRDWLRALPMNVKKEIGSDIERVQWRWPVSKPLVDGLGGGLYEVRTKYDGVNYRVLFCIVDSTMVLLHGFVKKARVAKERYRYRERTTEDRRRMNMSKNIGSHFTDWLDEEGIREDVELRAKKKILADQISERMVKANVTRTRLAKSMDTSRTMINRLLDPTDTSVTLSTLVRASRALGLVLLVGFEEPKRTSKSKRR